MVDHHDTTRPGSLREQIGVVLLRSATALAADRQSTIRHIAEVPDGVFGRERALSTLAFAGWVDSLLLWLAWRLLPSDALPGQVSPPGP